MSEMKESKMGEQAKVLTETECCGAFPAFEWDGSRPRVDGTMVWLKSSNGDEHGWSQINEHEAVRLAMFLIETPLHKRAEQAEKDRDEARGYCDDLCWMMGRCHACGHRLRFEASGCPQCRAKAVAPWNEPKEMPDTCKCDRCALARAGEVRA